MANDYYMYEEDTTDWALMEEEFHEWQVFNDAAALIVTKGYNYVLSNVMSMVADKENVL
jgi:hypothetical protein